MDYRELWGASSWQGRQMNLMAEEVVRLAHATLTSGMMFALPAEVTETSPDGHSATLMPTVKRAIIDPTTGERTFVDHPITPDVPVSFPGGGGVTLSHPIAKGDEATILYLSRQIDAWRQSSGSQQPLDNAINSPGDAVLLPSIRSDPRRLQQVSTTSAQLRSDDGHHTIDHSPTSGTTIKSVDPSTPAASPSFNPFAQATRFISHIVQGAKGLIGSAVDGATVHTHGVDHDQGAWMSAQASGGQNLVRAHPALGSLISALNGKHSVTATLGGVMLQSATSISLSCPAGGLSLPAGSIGGGSLSSGAASSNVGALSGDLSGALPSPTVTGILHVVGANALPVAANDAAAAALTPPVAVGALYRNGSQLMVRVA